MENVPQIVRERLKVAAPTSHHPDADVLTAFAERTLPERERANVLAHLARCGDCREVLALALPASGEVQPIFTPARSRWLTWPALRWGFAAAAGVVIVSLGIVQYQRHAHPEMMANYRASSPKAAASQTAAQPAAAAPATTAAEKEGKPSIAAPSSLDTISRGEAGKAFQQDKLIARDQVAQVPGRQTQAFHGAASGTAIGGPLLPGPHMPTQWQQQRPGTQLPPSAPAKQQAFDLTANTKAPSASQTVEVAGQAPPVSPEAQNAGATGNQEAQLQAESVPPPPGYLARERVDKAKAPVNVEAANVAAPQAETGASAQELPRASANSDYARAFTQLTGQKIGPLAVWTISPEGGLQRSYDQGKTWQDVDVNASLAPSAMKSAEALAETARAKDYEGARKALKASPAAIVFRAVTAIGREVWAGGSNTALYHSIDAGGHWIQVVPSSGGAVVTGDIVGLEFADARHGRITTSTGEVWITNDGGQTWQKQ